jgi:hypothetical protein
MTVQSKVTKFGFSIYIDRYVHLNISKNGFIGMKSEIDESKKFKWRIFIYTLSETIKVEYDSEEEWHLVLKELDACLTNE